MSLVDLHSCRSFISFILFDLSHNIIFQRLFVHRYRDIDPDIRMSCIESLGVWVLSYPSLFLQDLYLKYLGWTLNDKVSCNIWH